MKKQYLVLGICALIFVFASIIIGAAPASRVGDNHTCPLVTGGIPHVGGPILSGSSNVFICGNPAATVGSSAVCNGPADQVIQGSVTVLINGSRAARQGDLTAHGGAIIQGCPTVLIGP